MSDPQLRKSDDADAVTDKATASTTRHTAGATRATAKGAAQDATDASPATKPTRKAASDDAGEEPTHSVRQSRADRAGMLPAPVAQRRWVPPVFITVGLLGVLWLMVYYIAGYQIPQMAKLGNWNVLIGMGLMASSFIIATLWK